MAKKKLFSLITTISLALILLVTPCLIKVSETSQTVRTTTVEVKRQAVDYQSVLDEFEDAELETTGSLTTFVGYKSINLAELNGFDLVSETDVVENTEVSVKYNFSYDNETNIVTLSAELKDEFGEIQVDTLYGAAFINEYGEIDAVMNVDGEGILLSEMKDAGLIANCGWFSRLFKKVVTIVAVAAIAVVTVTAAVATAGAIVAAAAAAAPAVVAVSTGTMAMSAAVSTIGSAAAAGFVAAGSTALVTSAAAAATIAGVAIAGSIAETIIEEINGSITINNTYTIGEERKDDSTIDLVKNIAKIATIASLREMTRAYHIAFAVSQKFSENGTTYNVGDLYISKQSLTFDEAYAVLCAAGLVNSIENITNNNDIINAVKNILTNNTFDDLIEVLKEYQKNGYLGKKAIGIYADSVEAAATLASVTGAFIDDTAIGLVGMGGSGGYYHFHDLKHKIHIWYGSKIV